MTAAFWNVPASGRAASPVSTGSVSPEELLSRSGRGDETAFAQLYDATSSQLFGLVLGVVLDAALAEEVAQEAYLRVWRHSARFDPNRGSGLGWIMTTARRAAVDRVKNGASPTTSTTISGSPFPSAAPAM